MDLELIDYEVDSERKAQIDALLERLGLPPAEDHLLYHQALVHSSYTYETRQSPLENYERLEFLGDAVLKLVVSEYLFGRFPSYREGDLTKIRAVIVSDATLARLAEQIGLGSVMIFGHSEAKSGGRRKISNLACGFEALLGALYLDGHMESIRPFLRMMLEEEVTKVDLSKTKENFKAALQELTQADGSGLPQYRQVSESGPSHNKTFCIEVLVNNEVLGYGVGKTKKEAQQNAAKMALETLNELED
jgi:ribonuclease-3